MREIKPHWAGIVSLYKDDGFGNLIPEQIPSWIQSSYFIGSDADI